MTASDAAWRRPARPRTASLAAATVMLSVYLLPPAEADEAASERGESGLASWYGAAHQGRRTASGERFDRRQFTAAHPFLPFATMLRVTALGSGRSVLVRVNDRGPNHPGRLVDLSEAAAHAIGMDRAGVARVAISVLSPGGTPRD